METPVTNNRTFIMNSTLEEELALTETNFTHVDVLNITELEKTADKK